MSYKQAQNPLNPELLKEIIKGMAISSCTNDGSHDRKLYPCPSCLALAKAKHEERLKPKCSGKKEGRESGV